LVAHDLIAKPLTLWRIMRWRLLLANCRRIALIFPENLRSYENGLPTRGSLECEPWQRRAAAF
jgi:hypothetical protein